MFEGPAYESYIALCRALRLERTLEPGDWCFEFGATSYWTGADRPELYAPVRWPSASPVSLPRGTVDAGSVWLPHLDQWLDKLEEAGVRDIGFWSGDGYGKCCVLAIDYDTGAIEFADLETAPTRAEAAARLWMAVTGRSVDG